jgi:DNA-directed RNA polymerase subunit M/transcription elongation factor TFIIS
VLDDPVLGKRLEICLWNWMIRTCERDGIRGELLKWANPRCRYRYTTRALSLEFNLKNPGNPALLERVKSKALSVKALADMTPHQMWPEHWEPVYQRVAMQQMKREASLDSSKAPDGAYTCSRCKSRKTVYTSLQIRSADEPATIFVRCLHCGRAWKD